MVNRTKSGVALPHDAICSVQRAAADPRDGLIDAGAAAMKKIIFACVHNAGRSQMAAAFFHRLADPSKAAAVSAGTQPAERVHPEVVRAMKEVGIDLADARPRRVAQKLLPARA
jgi:hypothetical protein